MDEKIRQIKINNDIPFQTVEDKLEVLRKKINEIIEVINKCPQS